MAWGQVEFTSKSRKFYAVGNMNVDTARHFANCIQECEEDDDWLGTPRFQACAMVNQQDLELVLNGPPAEEFDFNGAGFVTLVSLDEEEGDQLVGLSYLVPRIYTLSGDQDGRILPGMGLLRYKDGTGQRSNLEMRSTYNHVLFGSGCPQQRLARSLVARQDPTRLHIPRLGYPIPK